MVWSAAVTTTVTKLFPTTKLVLPVIDVTRAPASVGVAITEIAVTPLARLMTDLSATRWPLAVKIDRVESFE